MTLGDRWQRWRRADRPRPAAVRADRVAAWLLIGPALGLGEYAELRERGVTHVIDLRAEAADDPAPLRALGLAWRHLPVRDREAPTMRDVDEAVAWIDAAADAFGGLYLHCEGGIGRTPTLAIALLMRRHGLTRRESEQLVQTARPEVQPADAQRAWLDGLEQLDTPHAGDGRV